MPWKTPEDWVDSEESTAEKFKQHLFDNMIDLFKRVHAVLSVTNSYVWLGFRAVKDTEQGSVTNTWTTRLINTVFFDNLFISSVSNNQFRLPVGIYIVQWKNQDDNINDSLIRLYNITEDIPVVTGTNKESEGGYGTGFFTLSNPSTMEIQQISTGNKDVDDVRDISGLSDTLEIITFTLFIRKIG